LATTCGLTFVPKKYIAQPIKSTDKTIITPIFVMYNHLLSVDKFHSKASVIEALTELPALPISGITLVPIAYMQAPNIKTVMTIPTKSLLIVYSPPKEVDN